MYKYVLKHDERTKEKKKIKAQKGKRPEMGLDGWPIKMLRN